MGKRDGFGASELLFLSSFLVLGIPVIGRSREIPERDVVDETVSRSRACRINYNHYGASADTTRTKDRAARICGRKCALLM